MADPNPADELKTALRNATKAAPKTPHSFALLPKGSSDGTLLVDKRKIPNARISAAKKAIGASTVVRGTCFGEEGALVMLTLKPQPPTMAALVKRIAQVQGGISIKPEFRVAAPGELSEEDEDDELEGDEVTSAGAKVASTVPAKTAGTPAAKPVDAAFQSRLAELVPRVKAAMDAGHPAANDLKLKTSQAGAAARGNDAAKAKALLDEVEALLKSASASGLGPDWKAAVAAYRAASDTVDKQITVLQGKLRGSGDPELAAIADKGLNGVTGNFKVPLLAVLRDLENAKGDVVATHAKRAVQIAAGFVKHIESAPTVAVCDSNPLAPVSIRATLGPALRQVARAAAAAA